MAEKQDVCKGPSSKAGNPEQCCPLWRVSRLRLFLGLQGAQGLLWLPPPSWSLEVGLLRRKGSAGPWSGAGAGWGHA